MAAPAARPKSLFLVASDLSDPAERAAYLDRECGGDADLRGRVEALLRANDASPLPPPETDAATVGSGPGRPAAADTDVQTPQLDVDPSPVSITLDHDTTARPNVLIAGRYTLQEKIGEGGMGEVWVAKQSEPVKRKVALKLIKPGMDSRAVLQRFEQERQALAMMDHPNIAKVLDGGLTPTGQPFFVMELVNGLPVNKYCDEMKLTPRERLELFVPICQAVQHAHQKGIVHRDLKPANILVTLIDGKPVPKVIDFGVAKATAGRLTDESMSTQFGSVVGTLEYMSPEQAGFSGVDIDTRADIYSLGVILYELLTGLRPIDAKRLRDAVLTEMIRIIREVEPSKPSTRLSTDESLLSVAALRHTEPRKLMALLRGELDWVVMKCLDKHRERRYETASGLARDIQRYLADEAVEARPPSAGYRFGKFVRRHKGQVIAASMVLLTVLGALAIVAGVQAAANRRLSESLARETRANTALGAANDRLVESRAAVQARYDLAVDAIKTFHTGVSEDFLLKEEKFKELRDRLLKSASEFYGRLGALLGKQTDPAARRALAQANFEMAYLTGKVGRTEDALAAHQAVLARREELAAELPGDVEARVDVGRSLIAVAFLLDSTGKTDDAGATYRKAEALLADLVRSSRGRRQRGPRWPSAGRGPGISCPRRASTPLPWKPTDWLGPIRKCWPPSPGRRAWPGSTWHARSIASASCSRIRASRRRRRPSTAGRSRSSRNWPTTTPPCPTTAAAWRPATTTSASCCCVRASRRRLRPSAARLWRSGRSWPTTTPPCPTTAAASRAAATTSGSCSRGRASRRRRRPSTARRSRSSKNLPTTTPPSLNSASSWRTTTTTSASCSRGWASRRRRRPSTAGRSRSSKNLPTTTPPSLNSATSWRTTTTTSASCCRIRASR